MKGTIDISSSFKYDLEGYWCSAVDVRGRQTLTEAGIALGALHKAVNFGRNSSQCSNVLNGISNRVAFCKARDVAARLCFTLADLEARDAHSGP